MFSNTTPLNWHSTLRRLRKEGDMGQLGRDMGVLPGRKAFTAELQGMVTKHRPTHVISEAAQPLAKSVNKAHKVNKALKAAVKKVGASNTSINEGGLTTDETTTALNKIPPGAPHQSPSQVAKEARESIAFNSWGNQQTEDDLAEIQKQQDTLKEVEKKAATKIQKVTRVHQRRKQTAPFNSPSKAVAAAEAAGAAYLAAQSSSVQRAAAERFKTPTKKGVASAATTASVAPSIHAATATLLSTAQTSAVNSRKPVVRKTPAPKTPRQRVSGPRKGRQPALEASSLPQPIFRAPIKTNVGPKNVRRLVRGQARSPLKEFQESPAKAASPEHLKAEKDPLKGLRWPGTLKLAKTKGLSEERIKEITGQDVHERGNTPVRVKKLKEYLRGM